ncbi:hypothetical protein HYU14_02215 [Candidatus Woesearchaeota archaeon]|nr:hypothetical protein [Candidatus Woesearchaeota archaeon]
MLEIETVVKEWGNSVGIVIPKEKALREELKANDRVTILLTKESDSLKVKDIFGSVKWRTPIKRMMDEINKEFE